MDYTVQVYDEFSVKYLEDFTSTLVELRSHKRIGIESLKKLLSNFFDCYLDPKTLSISVPSLADAYSIYGNECTERIKYYTKQKEMYDSVLQQIVELKDGSDRLEFEIPSEFLEFENKDSNKKIKRSIIYVIPFIEDNETNEGE